SKVKTSDVLWQEPLSPFATNATLPVNVRSTAGLGRLGRVVWTDVGGLVVVELAEDVEPASVALSPQPVTAKSNAAPRTIRVKRLNGSGPQRSRTPRASSALRA